jgi:transcriptional regulator with XRE-family HTH domain
MKLRLYLNEQHLTQTAFAKRIEISDAEMTRLLSGERLPNLRLCARIQAATNGKVTAMDFLPPLPAKQADEMAT